MRLAIGFADQPETVPRPASNFSNFSHLEPLCGQVAVLRASPSEASCVTSQASRYVDPEAESAGYAVIWKPLVGLAIFALASIERKIASKQASQRPP